MSGRGSRQTDAKPPAVHPVADLFPMLAADELAELAEDIKQRGLLHPIVLDGEGRILDGRNRHAACELAGVEPTFTTYDGDDPDGYALAVNLQRRNLSKAQRAIVMADAVADKNLSTRAVAKTADVSQPMIVWANAVRRYADLHDAVLAGTQALTDAYDVASSRDDAEAARKSFENDLRLNAPDLLALVDEGRLPLDDAVSTLKARRLKARQEEDARQDAAEREREQREQEHEESVERDRERLRKVITGWSTMRNIILQDSEGPRAAEIIAGLGEGDRLELKQIVQEIQRDGDDYD